MVLNSQIETQSRPTIHTINPLKNTKWHQNKKWSPGLLALTVRLCQIVLLHAFTLLAVYISQFLLCNKQKSPWLTQYTLISYISLDWWRFEWLRLGLAGTDIALLLILLFFLRVSGFSGGDKEARNNKHISSMCLSNIIPTANANHMTKPNLTVVRK